MIQMPHLSPLFFNTDHFSIPLLPGLMTMRATMRIPATALLILSPQIYMRQVGVEEALLSPQFTVNPHIFTRTQKVLIKHNAVSTLPTT